MNLFSCVRVLTYQPSTVRVPNVQALDTSYLTSSIADYSVPFHHSTLSTIPTDMQSMHLSSLPSNQICFNLCSSFYRNTNMSNYTHLSHRSWFIFSDSRGSPGMSETFLQRHIKIACMHTYVYSLQCCLPLVSFIVLSATLQRPHIFRQSLQQPSECHHQRQPGLLFFAVRDGNPWQQLKSWDGCDHGRIFKPIRHYLSRL